VYSEPDEKGQTLSTEQVEALVREHVPEVQA
jgi:hypothetical protein